MFPVSIEGCNYDTEYLGHGQHKTNYRLIGSEGSLYDGKVLKLSKLEGEIEPDISSLLSQYNVITPMLARGVCSFDGDQPNQIAPCLAWVTVMPQPYTNHYKEL